MRAIRILIADDHELVREGIRSRIESQPGWQVCAEATDGREAAALALEHRPDVVVMDIGMREMNGLEATRAIRGACPDTAVLILTMQESDALVRDALMAGARGFILKTDAGRHLTAAIDALLHQRPYFTGGASTVLLDRFVNGTGEGAGEQPGRLTPREREILQLLAEGASSKAAAAKLDISVSTVDVHRGNIMRKLRLHSVAELVRYAIRNNLIQP